MASRLLVDSHVLIWLLYEPERLGKRTTELIAGADTVFMSSVSLWELAIKHTKGKLAYTPEDLATGVDKLGLEVLQLTDRHVLMLEGVQLPHSDPFDTMLMAQSMSENCLFLTADKLLLGSGYKTHFVGE